MMEERKERPPLSILGGYVATLRPDECVIIELEGGILLNVYKALNSSGCRLRILASKHVRLRRLDADATALVVRSLTEGKSI